MNATEAMELYNTLFYVCMTVAILGLIAAAILFFALDIPTVFALLTGRARRKTVERIAKESKSGQLRKRKTAAQTLAQVDRTSSDLKKPTTEELPLSEELAEETSLLSEETETTLLAEAESVPKTELNTSYETRSKVEDELGSTEPLKGLEQRREIQIGQFELIESTIIVHTKEIII